MNRNIFSPSPSTIGPKIYGWWDFSDLNTLTLPGGGKISEVKDKSGNNTLFQQPSSADQPVQGPMGPKTGAVFDGLTDQALYTLANVSILNQNYFDFFMVCINGNILNTMPVFRSDAGSVGGYTVSIEEGTLKARTIDTGGGSLLTGGFCPEGKVVIVNFTIFSSGASLYTNGVLNETKVVVYNPNSAFPSGIGAYTVSPANRYVGEIGEIIMADSITEQYQRDLFYQYLKNKWRTA